MIGKTEEAILLTLMRLGTSSPSRVAVEISKHHPIAIGAVYTILMRMVTKGWVERRGLVADDPRGRGFPRGYFTILPDGRIAVRKSIETTKHFLSGTELKCPS